MTKSKVDRAIMLAIVALLGVLAWIVVDSIQEHIVVAGDTAPNFTIKTDSGIEISPRNFGGRVLVLNFWGTWCAPCVQEVPSLDQFQRILAGSGVVVLGVSVDRNEKVYRNFLKRFQVSFQTARDPDANISVRYGTFKYPETYIIDRNGKVVQKIVGPPEKSWTDPEMLSYVKSLL